MVRKATTQGTEPASGGRTKRSDAKLDTVLAAAMGVFQSSGVDAPVREIAEHAGVGLGTIYRNFPQRSDLIIAVFRNQVDSCADSAAVISKKYSPGEAVVRWIDRYLDFISTKRGLAAALHSGNPAYSALPSYFDKRLEPALDGLIEAAVHAGQMRPGTHARELLRAVATLCRGAHDEEPAYARKMIGLMLDGLRLNGVTPLRGRPNSRSKS